MLLNRPLVRLLSAGLLAVIACTDVTEPELSIGTGRRLSIGEYHACALDAQGTTFCWGTNTNFLEYGMINPTSSLPVKTSAQPFASLSGGPSQHTCALTTSRAGYCWGRGGRGEMGNGIDGAGTSSSDTGNPPTAVSFTEKWDDIRVGRLTTCGVTTTGVGYCWGLNQHGEIGDTLIPPNTRVTTPHKVIGGIEFTSIVPGWIHTCGIAKSGAAYCWGDNSSGQLGIGITDDLPHAQPLIVSFTQPFKKLALSARSTCGLTTSNTILCWGYNGTGQLGDGTTTLHSSPAPISSSLKFTDISMGSGFAGGLGTNVTIPAGIAQGGIAHACALATDGTVYCWGWNGAGQVGDGSTTTRLTPVPITGGVKMTSVALGGAYSCATGATAIFCWGANAAGQLGNATFTDSAIPVNVIFSWP